MFQLIKINLFKLLWAATDAEGGPIVFALESQPTNGVLSTFDANQGTVTYKPSKDYVGQDSFTFKATDDKGTDSNIATVTMDVKSANQAPVAEDQSVSVDKNKPLQVTLGSNRRGGRSYSICIGIAANKWSPKVLLMLTRVP